MKSQLRTTLAACLQRLGPSWLGRQQPGEITTVATRGLDGLDPYFARYLPQLVLACLVPTAVLVTVAAADGISAVIIAVTLPLIPVFAVLVGLHTRARTQRQWQLLARLGGHFLDVVEGLPTLKVFGRAKAAGGRNQGRHGRLPVDAHGHAARGVLVRAGAGTGRGAGDRPGRGGGRVAAARRPLWDTRPRWWCCCSPPRPTCRCERWACISTPAWRAPPRPGGRATSSRQRPPVGPLVHG